MKSTYLFSSILYFIAVIALAFLLMTLSGCKKWYDVPEDKDYFSERVDYTIKNFSPILGRTSMFSNVFNFDNSSIPLTFELQNVRKANGMPADSLRRPHPVWVWTAAYDGREKTLNDIEVKRKQENHPLWEVRKSGELILWDGASNELVPDFQGSVNPTGYLFDVKVSNSGGSKTIKDLVLSPKRSLAYEPTNLDAVTGMPKDSILPTELSGMIGQTSRKQLSNTNRDVYVYFKRVGDGHTLTFKFWDKDKKLIDPRLFNETKFAQLVHGFNLDNSTGEYLQYDVAYPIPVAKLPTIYTTSDGSKAAVQFSYSRLGFNGIRETGIMKFNFSIFPKGDWEIYFHFRNESPRFQNEF